ncbi:MAG: glycosyltransferase family 4 protein [Candidatus Bathyarchaeia archaeon]|jgi:glycosyltransferase involved in cell wall biosynthesis
MKVTLIRSRAITPNIRKVARVLSKNGYDVKLLLWDRQDTLKNEEGAKYRVFSFNLRAPYDKFSVLFYLPRWWMFELLFLLRDDSEVIHACDLDTLMPAILAKWVRRAKISYTIYDLYAANFQGWIARKLLGFIERLAIRSTDLLILVNELQYTTVQRAKIKNAVIIYNSPRDCFDGTNGQLLRHRSKELDEFKIFYAGAIHESRGLRYMIKAIRDLDDVRLTIAGMGPAKSLLDDLLPSMRKKIHYIGYIPYKKVIEKTMEADMLFAFYDTAFPFSKYASPNKLFEAMMCSKPIIVSDGGLMADIVRKVNCGLVVPYGDTQAISEAIVSLKMNEKLRQELGENGRKAYETQYSWALMEKRLIDSYGRLRSKEQVLQLNRARQ